MSNKAMSWATECSVTRSHKLILMLLADAHNGHTGECFPSQETLCVKSGYGESTVQACLKDLEDWGLITRETSRLGRGKGSRTNYVLHTQILDPQILEVQNSGNRPPENTPLDPQPTGGVYKDEPEYNRKEPEYAREIFEQYNQLAARTGWTVHSKLTDAIRKPLNARIEEYGAERVKAFIDAMATLPWTSKGFAGNPDFRASLVFICRPRTFAEHFDKLVKPDAPKREPDLLSGTGEPEIDHRLDWCFEQYAREKFFSGAWRGARYGWGWRPDEPEAAGLYPEALYVKHGVPRPGTDEAGRAA